MTTWILIKSFFIVNLYSSVVCSLLGLKSPNFYFKGVFVTEDINRTYCNIHNDTLIISLIFMFLFQVRRTVCGPYCFTYPLAWKWSEVSYSWYILEATMISCNWNAQTFPNLSTARWERSIHGWSDLLKVRQVMCLIAVIRSPKQVP